GILPARGSGDHRPQFLDEGTALRRVADGEEEIARLGEALAAIGAEDAALDVGEVERDGHDAAPGKIVRMIPAGWVGAARSFGRCVSRKARKAAPVVAGSACCWSAAKRAKACWR